MPLMRKELRVPVVVIFWRTICRGILQLRTSIIVPPTAHRFYFLSGHITMMLYIVLLRCTQYNNQHLGRTHSLSTPSLGIPAPPDHERVQVEGPVRQPDDLLELEVGLDGLGRVRVRVGVRVRVRVRVSVRVRVRVRGRVSG